MVQSEWIFLQCMTKVTVKDFMGMGKVLQENICLVFSLEIETLLRIVGALSTFLLKKPGMGLQNPVMSAQDKYTR